MPRLRWSRAARLDVIRLYKFLAPTLLNWNPHDPPLCPRAVGGPGDSPAFEQARRHLALARGRRRVSGLTSTARALYIPLFARAAQVPTVVIVADNKAADAMHLALRAGCDLTGAIPADRVLRLPAHDVLPFENLSPHPDIQEQRAKTLWKIATGEASIVVRPRRVRRDEALPGALLRRPRANSSPRRRSRRRNPPRAPHQHRLHPQRHRRDARPVHAPRRHPRRLLARSRPTRALRVLRRRNRVDPQIRSGNPALGSALSTKPVCCRSRKRRLPSASSPPSTHGSAANASNPPTIPSWSKKPSPPEASPSFLAGNSSPE
jgi:hypothetical protein